jgi:hydroxyacylglutathione hydrolase
MRFSVLVQWRFAPHERALPMRYQVVPVRALKDNYIWLLRANGSAAVVDPGEAAPVLEVLSAERLELAAILLTHHHPDHTGGVAGLLKARAVPVFGPAREPIDHLTRRVSEGETVEVPEIGASFQVLSIPGHTRAHIAYYGGKVLFCGDTLFACGCGRVFEGTPEEMFRSLQKLSALPDETLVYCAHEYTLANIAFARAVEPGNPELAERQRSEAELRERGLPTVPSTLARERATNPFLRCAEPAVIESANKYLGRRVARPEQVFAAIREWKNRF